MGETIRQSLITIMSALTKILVILIGPLSAQVGYLCLVVLIDVALGTWRATREKEFSLRYMISKTIEKIVIYGVWIAMGHAADIIVDWPDTVRGVVLAVLLGEELVSAISHTGKLGYKNLATTLAEAVRNILSSMFRTALSKTDSELDEEETQKDETDATSI